MRDRGESRMEEERLSSILVPQADSIKRLIQAIAVIRQYGKLTEENFDLSKRHINYFKQALTILGVLDSKGVITNIGVAITSAGEEERQSILRQAFENSVCGLRWLSWTKASSLDDIDPRSSEEFLRQCSNLKSSTVVRRGRTLRRWCQDLQSSPSEDPS